MKTGCCPANTIFKDYAAFREFIPLDDIAVPNTRAKMILVPFCDINIVHSIHDIQKFRIMSRKDQARTTRICSDISEELHEPFHNFFIKMILYFINKNISAVF